MPLSPDPKTDNAYLTRSDVSMRDKCAYMLEFLNERELQQMAEYVIDHIDSADVKAAVADYTRF